jgi:membrane protein DedA with SNARE-associated domain
MESSGYRSFSSLKKSLPNMPPSFEHYIVVYGYLAIFLIVFLQEIGVPTIVPNEISLFFFGYLASRGNIRLPIVLLTAIAAEVSGTCLLYTLFYFFGPMLSRINPKWFPIPRQKIKRLKDKINRKGNWGIFLGRMTPFIRGYTSVLAGLLQFQPQKYLFIVIASSICSTGGFVMAGWFLGPYWKFFSGRIPNAGKILLFAVLVLIILRIILYLIKIKSRKISPDG